MLQFQILAQLLGLGSLSRFCTAADNLQDWAFWVLKTKFCFLYYVSYFRINLWTSDDWTSFSVFARVIPGSRAFFLYFIDCSFYLVFVIALSISLWSSAVCKFSFFPWPFFPSTEERVSVRQECVSSCATSVSMKKSSARRWGNEIRRVEGLCLCNASWCVFPTLGQTSAGLSLDKEWPWLHRLQSSQTEKLFRIKHTSYHG